MQPTTPVTPLSGPQTPVATPLQSPTAIPTPSASPSSATQVAGRVIPFDKLRPDAQMNILGLSPTDNKLVASGRSQVAFTVTKDDGTDFTVPAGSTIAITTPKDDRSLYNAKVTVVTPDGQTIEHITPKKFDSLIDNARAVALPGPGKDTQMVYFDRGGIALTKDKPIGKVFDVEKLRDAFKAVNIEELAKDPSKITPEFQKAIVEALGLSIDPSKVQIKQFLSSNLGYAGIRFSIGGKTQDIKIPSDLAQGKDLMGAQQGRLTDIVGPLADPSKIPTLDPIAAIDAFNRSPLPGKDKELAAFGAKLTDEVAGALTQRAHDITSGLDDNQLRDLQKQFGLKPGLSIDQVRDAVLDRQLRKLNGFIERARNAGGKLTNEDLEMKVEELLSGDLEKEGRALPILQALTGSAIGEDLQNESIRRIKLTITPEEYLTTNGKPGIMDQVLLDISASGIPDSELPVLFAAIQAIAPSGVTPLNNEQLYHRLSEIKKGTPLDQIPALTPTQSNPQTALDSLFKFKEATIQQLKEETKKAPEYLSKGEKRDLGGNLVYAYLQQSVEERFRLAFGEDLAKLGEEASLILTPAVLNLVKTEAVKRGDSAEKIALIDELKTYSEKNLEQLKVLGAGLTADQIKAMVEICPGSDADKKILKTFLDAAAKAATP